MLKYIELKSGFGDSGPAWIARVKLSKSGRTLYFNRKALKRARSHNIAGNHFDIETGEEYWVSGVKKRGLNRHWAGSGVIFIEASAVEEYLRLTGRQGIDLSCFQVVADLPETDPGEFHAMENQELEK